MVIKMKKIEHFNENFTFNFVEYVPENYNGEKLPLIIQLHGAGERGDTLDDLKIVTLHGFSNHIQNKEIPCRFLMPQCPKNTFWAAKVESILKFVEDVKKAFPTDLNKIYLTGLSMGGFGTWFTAMASPDTFTAIAPVCGGCMDWNAEVMNMPIWVWHGADDNIVNVVYSDLMVEALKTNGKDVKYTRLDGVQHDSWAHTYNQELIDWFLSKSK